MQKSKIPLPCKISSALARNLETKHVTGDKKLPSNSKATTLVSKKVLEQPSSAKHHSNSSTHISKYPSKVSGQANFISKRLPSSLPLQPKNLNSLKKNAKPLEKRVINLKPPPVIKTAKNIENVNPALKRSKIIEKEEKPIKRAVPIKHKEERKTTFLSKTAAPKIKANVPTKKVVQNSKVKTTANVNKGSSFKHNEKRKSTVLSNRPVSEKADAVRPKVQNVKNPSRVPREKLKKDLEKVAIVLPIQKSTETANSAFGVDDSDFKESAFFKNMILSERALSPGIMKLCSAPIKCQQQKMGVDDFVAEIKRNSEMFHRQKQKLFQSPYVLPLITKSADEIKDEVRRASENYFRIDGKLTYSPRMRQKMKVPVDDIVAEIKRNSEVFHQRQKLLQSPRVIRNSDRFQLQKQKLFQSPSMNNRRWTCNSSTLSTAQKAFGIQRMAENRRESANQLSKKVTFFSRNDSLGNLNSCQKTLRNMEPLQTKDKNKIKKKVTFFIPPTGSPDLANISIENVKKLSDISEGPSRNCTPELEVDNLKSKWNSAPEELLFKHSEDSQITTPELNMSTLKLNFDFCSENSNTISDQADKNTNLVNNHISEIQTEIPIWDSGFHKKSDISEAKTKADFLQSRFLSLNLNSCNEQILLDSGSLPYSNTLPDRGYNGEEYQKPDEDVIQFCDKSSYNQCIGETGAFSVNISRKICTPHPVFLHPNSNQSFSVSPSFLPAQPSLCTNAPICTPMVLRSLAHSEESDFCTVRQKLDFSEKPNLSKEKKENPIFLKHIQSVNDVLCDQECGILSSQSSEDDIFVRPLRNPIADVLSFGDEMHFLPIQLP